MVLAQQNARLLRIKVPAAGIRDAYSPEAEGTVIEVGSGAYVAPVSRRRETDGARQDSLRAISVYVPAVEDIRPGDELTVAYAGREITLRVRSVIRHGVGLEIYPYLEIEAEEA